MITKNETMKNLIVTALMAVALTQGIAQEMKVITIVESIVPMGIGRSRIIEHQEDSDVGSLTTERTDGAKSLQGDIKRSGAKIEKFNETKLLNFYSGVGINFRNIASNDAHITSKVNQMINDGWSLRFVTSGVESLGSASDSHGIYITRLFFAR